MPPTASLAVPPASPATAPRDPQPLSKSPCGGLHIVGFDLPVVQEHRLRTMGVFEGQIIQLLKKSDPVIIKVAGARVALAGEIASGVYVAAADAQ